jgi:phage terminase small subunit
MLPNARHERFAQELSSGKSADEAYVLAGFKHQRQNAHRLMTNDDVMRRIAELQARASAKLEVTLQWLMEKAEEARALAMEVKQTAGAVSAIKELGVLSGHRVEKRENRILNVDEMTDHELLRIASGRSEGDASAPSGSGKPH